MVDCFINEEEASNFWKKNFLGKDQVMWNEFATALAQFFGFPASYIYSSDINFKCLYALVAQKQVDQTLKAPPDVVTTERFGNILGYFGPLTSSTESSHNFLNKVQLYLRQPWFHGELEKEQAEESLKKQTIGTFLVRLSSTKVGNFTITKVNHQGIVNHQRIEYQPNKGFGIAISSTSGRKNVECGCLVELLETVKFDLNLESSCPGSPFSSIFEIQDKSKQAADNLSGYILDIS